MPNRTDPGQPPAPCDLCQTHPAVGGSPYCRPCWDDLAGPDDTELVRVRIAPRVLRAMIAAGDLDDEWYADEDDLPAACDDRERERLRELDRRQRWQEGDGAYWADAVRRLEEGT